MVEYQCLRCYSCQTFQAKQVNKANKWSCSMCGVKQAVQRVYAISNAAKDIRLEVMKLNAARGNLEAAKEADGENILSHHDAVDAHGTAGLDSQRQQAGDAGVLQPPPMAYSQYMEQESGQGELAAESVDGEDDTRFVTSVQERRGRGRLRGGTRGGGGGRLGRAADQIAGLQHQGQQDVYHTQSAHVGMHHSRGRHAVSANSRMAPGSGMLTLQPPLAEVPGNISCQPYKQRAMVNSSCPQQPVRLPLPDIPNIQQHQKEQQALQPWMKPSPVHIDQYATQAVGVETGALQFKQGQEQQGTVASRPEAACGADFSMQPRPAAPQQQQGMSTYQTKPAHAEAGQHPQPQLGARSAGMPVQGQQASWNRSAAVWAPMPQQDDRKPQEQSLQQANDARGCVGWGSSRPAAGAPPTQSLKMARRPAIQGMGRSGSVQPAGLGAAWREFAAQEAGQEYDACDGDEAGFVTAL